MFTHDWTIRLTAVPLLCGWIVIAGCQRAEPPDPSDVNQRTVAALNALAMYYSDYLSFQRGRPPKDEAAFRKFVESRPEILEQFQLQDESLEQLFVSPRDSQPFTIVYGKPIKVSDSPGTYWAAYEQTGVDGKRMAARSYGGVDLLDAGQFAKEFPAD